MPAEMCPRCKALRDMKVSVSRRKEQGAGGKTRQLETRSYQCSACHITVRSEEVEVETQSPGKSTLLLG